MTHDEDPLEPAAAHGIKHRLLDRVADEHTHQHTTVQADDSSWVPLMPGVEIRVLHERAEAIAYLLRLQAGAQLPPHRHRHDETCVVLEGRIRIGRDLELGPGGYHLAVEGTLHATVQSDGGAVLFLHGAAPSAADILR
jgi:quercetin dioxygenase-like cupin family protein